VGKFLILILLIIQSLSVRAEILERPITTKERIRLALWMEGIDAHSKKVIPRSKSVMPEEIERSIRRL
jgi:hypothetical protein